MITLSIVTGTYNRLSALQRMAASVRRDLMRGVTYEIIVVDGGSTDGTIEWCGAQPDMRFIQQGELLGAIKAFCAGARTAQGEYVLLANDDIVFKPYGILAAISYLERTPTCAAVAFADNRTSRVRGNGTQYRVEGMGATTPSGQHTMVPYAQVGMFRRELGDVAGWWGDVDPIMSQARTYGGDNFLSSRLWEMGYTVDPVPLSVVEDRFESDSLRIKNNASGPMDSQLYYTRYPTVQLPNGTKSVPLADRLRIVHLPVYEWGHPQHQNHEAGLTEALAEYGLVAEVDYLNDDNFNLVELCAAWQPDLLLTQIQGAGPKLTARMLATARNVCPSMVVVNWNGDVYEHGLTSVKMLELLQYVDLQTVCNAKVLPIYTEHGILAAYWQIYYKEPVGPLPDVREHDVLFQGNCYNDLRDQLVKNLRSVRKTNHEPINLGIYGNCPSATGNTHYDFAARKALNQAATIVVGDTYPNAEGYVSNRVFQTLADGAFLLQQYSRGLQEWTGLVPNVHFVEWDTFSDLKEKLVYWLDPDKEAARKEIAGSGCSFVRANFSAEAQVRKLFDDLLPMVRTGIPRYA